MVILKDEGLSQRDITVRLGVVQSIVCRCLARHQKTNKFVAKTSSGQPRPTTPQTDNVMRRLVVANPTISSSDIKAHLPEDCDTSTRTIRRRLQKDFWLRGYYPAITIRLKDVKDRLQFARGFKH